jgi:AraC-like DNA-binding protein
MHDMTDAAYDGRHVLRCHRRTDSGRVVMGDIRYRPGGSCGPRVQRDVQLVMLHAGSCRMLIDSEWRHLPVGWASLHLPGAQEVFNFSATAETHHSWCACRPDVVPATLLRTLARCQPMVRCSPVYLQLATIALQILPPLPPERCVMLDQLALTMLQEFAAMARMGEDDASPSPLDSAIGHMEAYFGSPDCLPCAHEAAGISRNALICQFRQRFALTPARYLWRLRTERGIAMLVETGLSVGEIAQRCGFANPFHFSRLVRGVQGISPVQVRDQAWKIQRNGSDNTHS